MDAPFGLGLHPALSQKEILISTKETDSCLQPDNSMAPRRLPMISNFFVLRFSGISPYLSSGTFILPRSEPVRHFPRDRLLHAILEA